MKYGYATDAQAETWNAIDGATRDEAAINALAAEPDYAVVYVCEQQPIDKLPPLMDAADVDDLLERANEWASENGVGTWYEDDIYDSSFNGKAYLERMLKAAFLEWLARYPGPNVWERVNVTEHQRAALAAPEPPRTGSTP